MTSRVEIHDPAELSAEQIGLWHEFQLSDPLLQSPFLTPEFVQCIAEFRSGVRVAAIDGGTGGFLAFRKTGKIGRPVAGVADDCQALVVPPGGKINVQDLLTAAGLEVLDFTHVRADQAAFQPFHKNVSPSHTIDLSKGFDAYLEDRRKNRGSLVSHINRHRRRLERQLGEASFAFHTAQEATLDQLITWKNGHYEAMGVPGLEPTHWMTKLLRHLLHVDKPQFAGVLSSLSFGGQVVAAHIGIRSRTTLHQWFPTYNPEFSKHSPGLILMIEMCRACAENGLHTFELGAGHEDYKGRFANSRIMLASGFVGRPSLPFFRRKAISEVGSALSHLPIPSRIGKAPDRLLRRMANS